MSDVKHTNGPWSANWSKYQEGVVVVQAGMPSNRVLARFDGDGDGPDEQSLADAHLISAAPEMLEALKELADLMDDIVSGNYAPDSFTSQPARAAIRKAEGRTP